MRHLIIVGLVILLSSCAGTKSNYYTQTVQSWQGGNINQLIKLWGRPDGSGTGSDGHKMVIYRTQSNRNNGSSAAPSFGVTAGASGRPVLTTYPSTNRTWNRGVMSQTCTAAFEADKRGTIIATQVKGTGCYAGESFANSLSNPNATKANS